MRSSAAGHLLTLGAVVYGVWLLLSGHYTPWFLIIGLVCTAFAVFIASRMEVVDHEGVPVIHLTNRILTYLPWLVFEVVRSNLAMLRFILSRDVAVRPKIFKVRGRQRTDLGRVIFANSITLTPGTVTLAVTGDIFYVHAIDASAGEGLDEAEMNYRVASLERGLIE